MIRTTRRATFAAALSLPFAARAQDWSPREPIRLINPFAPGGSPDILARVMAPHMQGFLGQPMVVENRPGAGAAVGTRSVARAAPDGLTVLLAPISSVIDGLPKNRRERSCGWRRSPWPEVWLTKAPDGQMRGPGILPASMAALSSKIGPPASRTLVKPRSRVRADSVATVAASFSGLASGASRSA